MARTIEIPDNATMVDVDLDVSTKAEGHPDADANGKVERTFKGRMAKTLADAVAEFGEKEVFRLFCNAYAIKLQGAERQKIAAEVEGREGGTGRRAKYADQLGL